jgi:predicted dehydrogenase
MNEELSKVLDQSDDVDRRAFIKGASISTLMMMMGGTVLVPTRQARGADAAAPKHPTTPPVKCGVIGCGGWGREIVATLGQLPNAPITALCDTYGAYLRRTARSAPGCKQYDDYKQLLADDNVEAVFIATPTHLHREMVEAAIKAGKHVYCEAPIAQTLEDARAIALAAKKAPRLNFQTGLNFRSDPQRHFLMDFIGAGSWGKTAMARAQYHKKQSWRRTSADADQEKLINWRLDKTTSLGLIGEMGIHQIDIASWFIRKRPVAVNGFGSIINWNDGRDVDDTIQAVFEYGGPNLVYDATLANSFDSDYEMYFGTDAALMVRGQKAWMFKEVDAPLLGWEVYARKDQFYKEVGIALVSNATKLTAITEKAEDESPYTDTPLRFSVEAFISNTFNHQSAVKDFLDTYGNDEPALLEYLKEMNQKKLPAADMTAGFEATVVAIAGNEAVRDRKRVEIKPEWFELA